MGPEEVRFIADSMLGRLSKWLRIMGFDTYYRPFYRDSTISDLIKDGYLLLTRHKSKTIQYPNTLFILSDKVGEQLQEMRKRGYLHRDKSRWFTRCVTCNNTLREVSLEDARENIPDYIFYQNIPAVRFCPSCLKYYWPGSHRDRMIIQLEEWGIAGA